MIRTVMAEFQLEGFSTERQAAQLVPQADSKHGNMANELLNIFHGVVDGFRIAGAVRKKHSVRFHFQDVFRGGLRGDDIDFALVIDEQAQNVLLDAVVVSDNTMFARLGVSVGFAHLLGPGRNGDLDGAFVPAVGFGASDAAGELLARHTGQLLGFKHKLLRRRTVGGNDAAKRTDIANVADERAGINVPNHGNLVTVQIELRGFRGSPVRRDLRKFAHDERFDVRPRGLFVLEVRTHVSDMRVRETDNLPGIAGVGENFLVTGEAGIENDFAAAARDRAGRAAVKG